jgi:uncharacterized coiled-coil DUF342 family protein
MVLGTALLQKKLGAIEAQAMSLKERLSALDIEAEKWASKRNSLNDTCKKIGGEIRQLQIKRDRVQHKIRELTSEREDLRASLKEKYREYDVEKTKTMVLTDRTFQSKDVVRRKIQELDWKIQTTPLKPLEETQIINQIKTLEQEALVHNKISVLKKRVRGIRLVITTIKRQSEEINTQIDSFATERQENQVQLTSKIKAFKMVKTEADEAHQRFLEYLKELKEARLKYVNYCNQLRDLSSQIHIIEEENRKLVADAELEARSKTATEKLKQKKKMSFQEFKALSEKGLV